MDDKLRIGRLSFVNIFPVFHALLDGCDCGQYEFVDGYPSALNRMLREGEIDISPSSSIEYLRHRDSYFLLEGHSISSTGPVGSILLFSRVPIENLDGHEVFVTHQSETSVALLKLLLKKFHGLTCSFAVSSKPFDEAIAEHSAYLSIGDEAIRNASRARDIEQADENSSYKLVTMDFQAFYVYDLGGLWYGQTRLPFVFALWIGRKESLEEKQALVDRFARDLADARDRAINNFPVIARTPGLPLSPEELVKYWEGIHYGFCNDCLKGLELFNTYLKEEGLLFQ